ncbi:hypothetical protein CKM354_000149200 [Cercospora kikuchii]|uniref:Uncharacterized protein n=1 Tax=Cercospora kikuchii TaxID=84275 RepID=A0A9P3C8C8_9PEZI|nr:uncharacterized protein CKM354_000149200 [Cercospora kikuchii]GIZ38066.1 hypothetical protein CKM354_000149200 [Cercospora kikuchii]
MTKRAKTKKTKKQKPLVAFGPPETDAIFNQKWLLKLGAHVRDWPGLGFPWSAAAMPGWCEIGCRLATEHRAARKERAMRLREPPIVLEIDFWPSYPLYESPSHPVNAVFFIAQLVDEMMVLWSLDPGERNDGSLRPQIIAAIDQVESAQAKKLWAARPDPAVFQIFRKRLFEQIHEEVESRIGKNAPESEKQRAVSTVLMKLRT